MGLLLLILLAGLLIYVFKGIIIVQTQEVVIIQRFGRYLKTLEAGPNFILPFFDAPRAMATKVSQRGIDGSTYAYIKMDNRIDLREKVYDFPRQDVITKDNVSIGINAILYYQVMDPKNAVYSVENPPMAIEQITQTNLRNLVGLLDLQEILGSRDKINHDLRTILDEATSKWGIKITRVELKDIKTPADIQASMDKLMKADREKKATITEAEGLKEAAIRKAEGQKEAAIRAAEGERQAEILRADGVAQARIIEANAEKEAIQRIIEALQDKGQPDKYLIAMKYLTTLNAITSGENNKIVYMPYEATGILSSVDGIKEMFNGTAGK